VIDNPRIFPDFSYFKQTGTSPLEIWYPLGAYSCATFSGLSWGAGGKLIAIPFTSGAGNVIDYLGIECTVANAGAKARCGIYDSVSETNLYPNNLIVDSGEFDMSTLGVKSASVSVTLKPNKLYWAAFNNGGGASCSTRSMSNAAGKGSAAIAFPNGMGTGALIGLTVAKAYGALPSTFTASATTTGTAPFIFARFSS